MSEAKSFESGRVGSISGQLDIFRATDVLLGINQACSEMAHQLRIAHLYQLKKDHQGFRQKFVAVALFLVTLLPSLSSLISAPILRFAWITSVILLSCFYVASSWDKLLKREVQKDYEDVDAFDRIVNSGRVNLLRDYIFGYCNRHEMLFQIYPNASNFERASLMNVLESYQGIFNKAARDLLDLRQNGSRLLSEGDYTSFTAYMDFCKSRYSQLRQQSENL